MNKLIDLQSIMLAGKAEKIVAELFAYPKYKSLVAMAVSNLPIPKTIIIGNLEKTTEEYCKKTVSKWNVNEVCVRTDRLGKSINSPSIQGCEIRMIWSRVKSFFNQGYLPMIISTGDIFHNTFSANVVIDPENSKSVYMESAGPGFCASDINKRDIINESGTIVGVDTQNLRGYKIVDDKIYKYQINLMMENQIQKEEKNHSNHFKNKKEAYTWVIKFLTKKKALILKHPIYKPIASKYVSQIWDLVPLMIKAGYLMGFEKEKYIVSFSFVLENNVEHPYFWDIHPYEGYIK